MLSGLEIILERIKEYPEEMSKWASLVNDYAQHFTQEEVQAWQGAITQMERERFNEKVLKRLSGEDVEVQKQVAGFQNEVSRIVAAKQQNIMNQATTSMYGTIISGQQSAYANNYR